MPRIKKDSKINKINNAEAISRTTNKNPIRNGSFPPPRKVVCSKCGVNEFYIKFVISRLAYSRKNNWGY